MTRCHHSTATPIQPHQLPHLDQMHKVPVAPTTTAIALPIRPILVAQA